MEGVTLGKPYGVGSLKGAAAMCAIVMEMVEIERDCIVRGAGEKEAAGKEGGRV